MKKFNYLFLLLHILILAGCASNSSPPKTTLVSKQCPPRPPNNLVLKNPQVISLASNLASVGKGSININQTVGYLFQGNRDQKLSLELKPNQTCIWVITPNDEVLKEKVLPQSGQYIVQLAASTGEKIDYELSMGLDVRASPTPLPSPTPKPSPEYVFNFPLSTCGDPMPNGVNTWYPVFVENTPENLQKIKNNYCQDAFLKKRKDSGVVWIQVASFLDSDKARYFSNIMQTNVAKSEVGPSTVR
jgi:hypothetical protein